MTLQTCVCIYIYIYGTPDKKVGLWGVPYIHIYIQYIHTHSVTSVTGHRSQPEEP